MEKTEYNKKNKTYKQKCEDMVKRLLSEGHINKIIIREVKKLIKRLC